jgi:hypothetical protein
LLVSSAERGVLQTLHRQHLWFTIVQAAHVHSLFAAGLQTDVASEVSGAELLFFFFFRSFLGEALAGARFSG